MDNHHRKATRAISVNLIEAVYLTKNYIRKQNKTGKGVVHQCWNHTWQYIITICGHICHNIGILRDITNHIIQNQLTISSNII